MKGWPYGRALTADKKTIRYLSPSALMTADPGTSEGCLRRWFYQYVKGLKQEETNYQLLGRLIHQHNENYLLTGALPVHVPAHGSEERRAVELFHAGLFMLPKPRTIDSRILVEHEIGGGDLEKAPLRAHGIPVVGSIDVIHWQGTNAGTSDVINAIDPQGTVEVLDHKSTSGSKWIKSAQEMSRTLQMTVYGKWAVQEKQAEQVRLSHGNYITKGRDTPRKVSLRVHRDQIDERWEYVEHLASSLAEIVTEDNPDKVPGNTRACGAYRGCPHQPYCTAYAHNSLSSLIGSDFASSLLGLEVDSVLTIPTTEELTKNPGLQPMSLLAKLQAATAPAKTPELQSEMRRLAIEEIDARYPGIGNTISKLEALGLGMPALAGEAARVYAVVKNLTIKAGAGLAGSGELAQFSFDDPAQLSAVLTEAESIVASRETSTPPINPFPADAPPALASPPAEAPKAEPVTTVEEAMAVAAGEKPAGKKRGPKPKVAEPAPEAIAEKVEQIKAQEPKLDSGSYRATVPATGAINLYVDCIPSCGYQSLWPYVNELTAKMAQLYGGEDYRTCKGADVDFGKWKGVLAAALRKAFTLGQIPAGNYLLDYTMNDTASTVIEAMRDVVAQSGGVMVRGIR